VYVTKLNLIYDYVFLACAYICACRDVNILSFKFQISEYWKFFYTVGVEFFSFYS
jgi:hypothetical protein